MRAAKVYDISAALVVRMSVWPGNTTFSRAYIQSLKDGANADVSIITMGSHAGTHVDAQAHFISGAYR